MAIAVRIARARIEFARGDECALDRGTETAVGQRLVGEGLQHAHRTEQFGCIGGGVGERVLRRTRAPAHRAAEAVERQDDHGDRREHKGGKPRACHDHHGARAHEQNDVAQCNGNRGTHGGLDLRGIGGEPRDQFAGLGRIEVGGRERDQVAEHALAQIGHDPFAQRGDEIKTRRARQSENGHDADQDGKIAVDQARTLLREPKIDHPPDRDRHDQCRDRRDHEDHQRRDRSPAIAGEVGHERQQRPELAALRRLGRGGLVRLPDRRAGRPRGVSLDDVHLTRPLRLWPKPDQSGATLPRWATGGNRLFFKICSLGAAVSKRISPHAMRAEHAGSGAFDERRSSSSEYGCDSMSGHALCGRCSPLPEFRRGTGSVRLMPCFVGPAAL